jgi:hypothetical protein
MSLNTCANCRLYRSERCFGKETTCDDFRAVPLVTKEEKESWPREMINPGTVVMRDIRGKQVKVNI